MSVSFIAELVIAPVHPTHLGRNQHNNAESDAIPGEYGEIMSANKTNQSTYCNECANKRHRSANGEQSYIVHAEQITVLVHIVKSCGKHGGYREKK